MIPTRIRTFSFIVLLPFFLVSLFIGGKARWRDLASGLDVTYLSVLWVLAIILSVVVIDYFAFDKSESKRIWVQDFVSEAFRINYVLPDWNGKELFSNKVRFWRYTLSNLIKLICGLVCLSFGVWLILPTREYPFQLLDQLLGLLIVDVGVLLLILSVKALFRLTKMRSATK